MRELHFLFKSYHDLKPAIDSCIKEAWSCFPGNERISGYATRRNNDFSVFDEKLVLDVDEEVVDGNGGDEGFVDEGGDFDGDEVFGGKEDEVVGLKEAVVEKEVDVVDEKEDEVVGEKEAELVDDDVGVCEAICSLSVLNQEDEFTTPNVLIAKENTGLKVSEPGTISAIPIQSVNPEPIRAKRIVKPSAVFCSPYNKKVVDAFARLNRQEERVAGSLFMAIRHPRYY